VGDPCQKNIDGIVELFFGSNRDFEPERIELKDAWQRAVDLAANARDDDQLNLAVELTPPKSGSLRPCKCVLSIEPILFIGRKGTVGHWR
jgi:hypothetical protein